MRLVTVFLCALMLSPAAFGQRHKSTIAQRNRATLMQPSSSTFEIGTQLFSYNYSEVWEPPGKSNESGFIPGLALAYTYRGSEVPIYARGSFEYTQSKTTYDGGLMLPGGGMVPLTNKTNNRFTRYEVQGGYIFRIGRQISITPYVGFAHRAWTRLLSGEGGYEERYSWSYAPVGVRGDMQIGRSVTVGLDAAMRFMFAGQIEMLGFVDSPTLDLGNKLGFKLSLPSSFKLSPHWALGIEPWMEFSGINESNHHFVPGANGLYVYEPESSTSIFGASVTMQYGF